jgi:hypothetical protein
MLRFGSACAVGVIGCGLAYAAACGLEHTGTLLPMDAGADVSIVDASSDAPEACAPTSVLCNGACVATCDGCEAGAALCPTDRVCSHCASCSGYEIECFACADGGPPTTFCSMPSQKCGIAAANHCPCTFGEPMDCPGKSQVCLQTDDGGGACFACGEDGSENVTCANGLECVSMPMPPSCSGS